MNALDRLKRDHTLLRAKLDVLNAALGMGPAVWFVLREICFTLGRQLGSHIKREERLLRACREALSAEQRRRLEVDHHDEPEHLQTVNRLFLQSTEASIDRVRPLLKGVIEGLRRHMDDEETSLFPLIERTLEAREPGEAAGRLRSSRGLTETMTVNHVVHQYPHTKRIFEQFFINITFEGSDYLDEVAWRHGLETRELLKRLTEAN